LLESVFALLDPERTFVVVRLQRSTIFLIMKVSYQEKKQRRKP